MSELSSGEIEAILGELAERIAAELAQRLASEQGESGEQCSPWMGIEKAAAYLDWPKQRLYKLSASGAIPHYKQEGRLLFHRGRARGLAPPLRGGRSMTGFLTRAEATVANPPRKRREA